MIQLRCASPFQTGTSRTSLGVGHDITDIFSHLHQIGLYIESRLTGAGATNYNHVLVPCKFWQLWSAVHGQPFRHGKKNIVFKYWVDKRCNVFCSPPSCRTILFSLSELFGIFHLHHNQKFYSQCPGKACQKWHLFYTWQNRSKCHLKIQKQHHQPFHQGISPTVLIQPCFFIYQIKDYDIRSIQCQKQQGISFQIFP